jgi:hypothetical protein
VNKLPKKRASAAASFTIQSVLPWRIIPSTYWLWGKWDTPFTSTRILLPNFLELASKNTSPHVWHPYPLVALARSIWQVILRSGDSEKSWN